MLTDRQREELQRQELRPSLRGASGSSLLCTESQVPSEVELGDPPTNLHAAALKTQVYLETVGDNVYLPGPERTLKQEHFEGCYPNEKP